jgi:hypothetical protein
MEDAMNSLKHLLIVLLASGSVGFGIGAALAADGDATTLAKAAQNPLATMVTLPMQANYFTGVGEYERTFFNLNVQPVVPYPGEKWNVIVRTILPINSVPEGETDSRFGIGDTQMSFFLSPNKASAITWGLGPIFVLPTASNPEVLGSGKWGVGPTGVFFFMAGKWTMGAVAGNTWSFAGDKDRDSFNRFFMQYFINFNFGGCWALGTAPIVSADWYADDGQHWTVPWGLQLSKVTHFGKSPVNLLVGYYHNSEHPTGGPQNQTRVQINFLFPTGR